jgi:hypothetical protein
MIPTDRRRFLANLGRTGALLASASWLDTIGYAQIARGLARAFIRPARGTAHDVQAAVAFVHGRAFRRHSVSP